MKRFTVFVTDVSKFCGKKSLRELGCAFSVARCTVPLTYQQQIYFPCGLLDLFSAASEFAVIFKLLYSGTDKDCVFYFCISDSGNWHRLVDVKHLHSDLHKIHHHWCYMEVEQFFVHLQVGHCPTPFYLFSEISCLWLGHSVMAYWVQEHWGWNHKFSNGVYDVCYQAEVSYFVMLPLTCVTCPSGLIVKCCQCEEWQHSGLILKNLWMVASHQTYTHSVVQFICSVTLAVR